MSDSLRSPSPGLSSSPPLSCSGSASSSTLIVTPQILKLRERCGIDFKLSISSPSFPSSPHKPNPDLKLTRTKGHLEPHVSNLPRRRKRASKPAHVDTLVTSPSAESKTLNSPHDEDDFIHLTIPLSNTDLQVPSVPLDRSTSDRPPSSTPKGHLQPHVTNLPRRRRKPLTEEELESRRVAQVVRRSCRQEVGSGSGVFIAFEAEEPADAAEKRVVLRTPTHGVFSRVIRICAGESGEEGVKEDMGVDTLRLFVPPDVCNDDGSPHLTAEQLLSACEFLQRSRTNLPSASPKKPHPILITTPTNRPVDAISIAALYLALTTPSSPTAQVWCTPTSSLDADSAVHTLLMRMHDLSDDEEADGGTGGLKAEWRGVLSRDGMDFLGDLLVQLKQVAQGS